MWLIMARPRCVKPTHEVPLRGSRDSRGLGAAHSLVSCRRELLLLLLSLLLCPQATEALRITAPELIKLEVMDEVIPEPLGGAHRSAQQQQQQPHASQHAPQLISCTRTQEACKVCRQPVCVSRLQVGGIGATTTC